MKEFIIVTMTKCVFKEEQYYFYLIVIMSFVHDMNHSSGYLLSQKTLLICPLLKAYGKSGKAKLAILKIPSTWIRQIVHGYLVLFRP